VLGQSVRSGQCILCQRCAHACPANALHLAIPYALVPKEPNLSS
jgi:formate hydrogenlyase subunit 6/NADH:ubiquinone oxidoreductase subunit I